MLVLVLVEERRVEWVGASWIITGGKAWGFKVRTEGGRNGGGGVLR